MENDEIPPKFEEEVVDPGDGGGTLPPMWGYGKTREGRLYFLNHWQKTTTWKDPRKRGEAGPEESHHEAAGHNETLCQAFLTGHCPMGGECLFLHVKKGDDFHEKLDGFELTVTLPCKEEIIKEENKESDLEGLQIEPSLWRFTSNPADFRKGDKVLVVSKQESPEEYTKKQLEKLGKEGVVKSVATGGYFVVVSHFDGVSHTWHREDLMVHIPVQPEEEQVEKIKKKHKLIKKAENHARWEKAQRKWAKDNYEYLMIHEEHARLNAALSAGRGRGRGRGRGSWDSYNGGYDTYNYEERHSRPTGRRQGSNRPAGVKIENMVEVKQEPAGRGRGRGGWSAYITDYEPTNGKKVVYWADEL